MNIFILILLSIEGLMGFGINIKKIQRVRVTKQITWELEIYSSVICMIYFTLVTFLDIFEYTCPELNSVVGFVIHYVVPIFETFGVNVILFHSFGVGAYKYYMILETVNIFNSFLKWGFKINGKTCQVKDFFP